MPQELAVAITGATGKQGGAVARGLLERGHKVRAVTRDTNSSQAKSLASAGATLVAASLEDTAALTQALEGAGHRRRDTTRCCSRRGQGRRRTSCFHFRRLRQPTDGHSAFRQQV
jgi:NAD(P)-dependent dehydrogenase (short-subunit alcohol dehydrogenase family)